MKKKRYSRFLFLLIFCIPFSGMSATYYSRINGNWTIPTTWSTVSCAGAASLTIPGPADNVIICAGRTVTMNAVGGSCLSLTINGTANWTTTNTTNVGLGGLTMAGGTVSGSLTGKLIVAGAFNVPAGTSTFARGTLTVTGISTITGTLNWTSIRGKKTFGNLIIAATGNFNNSANESFTVQGNFQNDGVFTSGSVAARYTFSGAAKTITGASATTITYLTVTGSYTNSTVLSLTNTFSGAGTFTQGATGTLNFSGGSIAVNTFNASAAGNIVNYNMAGNFNIPIPSDLSYSNLRVSSGSTKRLIAVTTVGASLLIASPTTLNANNFNLKVGGNFTNNNAFTAGTATVTMNGAAAQTITGTAITNFNNLTISNASGITLGINTIVAGVLNFTAGVINTAINKVTISVGGSVAGAGTSKFVNGSLEKSISAGAGISRTFEVGFGATDYLPVTMTFATVTAAGKITAKANNGDHPNIGTCCLDDTKSVNRYWQLTNLGTAFTTYTAVCNFIGVPTDADAGSAPANYFMAVFNAGVWNMLTPGIRTATSTQSTGVTIIGDLQIGEKRVPVITIQPLNTTVCNNTSATFSITATGTISYQWQQNAGAGFVNLANGGIYSGVTTATLLMSNVTNLMNTYLYRCIINSSCGASSLTSNSAILTVTPNVTASITISAAPSTTICAGTNVTFTATPVNGGTTPSYQWKINGANVGINSPTFSSTTLTNGNLVTCVLTSNAVCVLASPATSNTITMTVNPSLPVSVSISVVPSSTICAGTSVTFTATPTNGGGAPAYQWKKNGVNIGGATASTFISAALVNGDAITCILTSSALCATGNPATSNIITMTVNPVLPASVSITVSPSSTVCAGTSVTFTATPTNGGAVPTYQWKKGGVNIGGATSSTFISAALITGNVITCVMTSSALCVSGSPATSNSITMTVNPNLPVSVSIAATATIICAGTNVTFTATPTNGGAIPAYQWKLNGVNVGINSTTYSSSTLNNGDLVTCVLTSNATCATGNPATSNTITMTVNPNLPVSISISASATTICPGTNVTFTATPTNGGAGPTYQWKKNGVNIGGATASTYSSAALTNGNIITCILTSNALCATGNPATSNAITMVVNPALPVSVSISASPSSIVCSGTNVTFTATPTNGGTIPTYQWKKNGVNIGGATATTFSSSTLITGDMITCIMTAGGITCGVGSPATSNTITMTVNANLPVSVSIGATATTICAGTNVTFTATPTNGGAIPAYQWKVNGVNAGINSATYSSTTLNNGDLVTCVLTSNATCTTGNPATSNTITMTVNPNLPVSVSISASPAGAICSGTNVTFTATPTNGGAIPSYQWKLNGINVGINSSAYSNAALANGNVITCVLTSNATCATGNPATSGSITMAVNPNLPVSVSITASPSNNICSGTNVTFTATPTNGGTIPVYQWKLNGGNVGGGGTTYSNSALVNGDVVTCVLTSNAACATGNPATSNTVTMTVSPNLPVSISISASPSGTICAGSNVLFTATPVNGGAGPSYQWKLNGGNVGTNSSTYNNSTLITGDVVTCILTSNATCVISPTATSNSISFIVTVAGTWLGSVSADWNTAANWCGGVPTNTTNVVIPAGTTFAPSLSNNSVCKNITVNAGGTFNLNTFSIDVRGNFINNGTFNPGTGTLVFNGPSGQTISSSNPISFYNLTIDNLSDVILSSGIFSLDGALTVSNGIFNTAGHSFTMTSTATQTARIAPLSVTAAIIGNFIIERFITTRDTSYCDLSSPNQNSIFSDWDNELPAISYSSGSGSLPSAYTYNETSDAYVPITTSGTALSAGQGFEVFLSGGFSYTNFPATIMNTIGVPNQGDQDLSGLISNNVQGWNLVGNPFASSISWSDIYAASGAASSGLYDFIEMYDYTIADWNGYTSADGIEIGSTQGFWVYGLPGATPLTLLIPESSKTTASNSTLKTMNVTKPYMTLKISSADHLNTYSHTFKIAANKDASDGLDILDLPYRPSPNKTTPEIYSMIDGKKMNLNIFNSDDKIHSIELKTTVGQSGRYEIDASGLNFLNEYTCIKLEDKLLNKMIDLTVDNKYIFNMTSSDADNRFVIYFSKNDDCKQAVISGISEDNSSDHLIVFPNPFSDVVTITSDRYNTCSVEIYDLIGKKIFETLLTNNKAEINMEDLQNGIYFIHIKTENGIVVKQVVKQ